MRILIDGDILIYKFGWANVTTIDWGQGDLEVVEKPEEAISSLSKFIMWLFQTTNARSHLVALTTGKCFRYDLWPAYKEHRKNQPKPKILGVLRDYMKSEYMTVEDPMIEADDILGRAQDYEGQSTVIASTDKDLLQIPGLHFNFNHEEFQRISQLDADKCFYIQSLTGDTTDNFPGCPGIGQKKAEMLIGPMKNVDNAWNIVKALYAKKGFTEDQALTQARLARILRRGEYPPNLWVPNGSKGDPQDGAPIVPGVHPT